MSNLARKIVHTKASHRVAEMADILLVIFSFLTPSGLFAITLTSKAFNQLSIPLLYGNIVIKPSTKAEFALIRRVQAWEEYRYRLFQELDKDLGIDTDLKERPHDKENYEGLDQVVIKLRPCDIPTFEEFSDEERKELGRTLFPRETDSHQLKLPLNTKRLKLIWFDENHKYNTFFFETTYHGPKNGKNRYKVCSSCGEIIKMFIYDWKTDSYIEDINDDGQNRCEDLYRNQDNYQYKKYRGLRNRILDLFRLLGKMTNLERIDIYNFDLTAQIAISCHTVDLNRNVDKDERAIDQLKEDILKAFRRGKKENEKIEISDFTLKEEDVHESSRRKQRGNQAIWFYSFEEYYPIHMKYRELDEEEFKYFQDRVNAGHNM
ncbi:uncharacterized protein L201_000077 [Kwoniella dendrophila CBS 6074]|uniref:F-box domain-containing protein n=1 Tax=Kwoniella dendrophila CBS 6074 TaxID=1295534 RepID=A0AAX4JJX3_9TREE